MTEEKARENIRYLLDKYFAEDDDVLATGTAMINNLNKTPSARWLAGEFGRKGIELEEDDVKLAKDLFFYFE